MRAKRLAALAVAAALGCGATAAGAAEITVELNKLEPAENACTAYLLINNASGTAYDVLRLELYFFDANGQIHRNYAYDIAPLRAGKRSVKAFLVNGIACDGISEVLLSDVLDCQAGGAAQENCLEKIETSSRTDAPLVQ